MPGAGGRPDGAGRGWIALGALFGLVAVALSAWAAHAPAAAAPDTARLLGQALTMQGWHALALVLAGLLAERRPGALAQLAAAGFALGTVLFCGAVWNVALTGRSLGGVAPAGGVLLMLGWALLALAGWRRPLSGGV
ncbi:DUF423 domain-containing protein [Roseomonas sp. BN140053]|uniref:DUF423 domain-containing protein n=1 Tax=Roseomonas sp. BN140053 TaxID=3391898 RepID=UPI0039EA1225